MATHLARLARWAEFLDDDNAEYFDVLASYAHLGLVPRLLREDGYVTETEMQHRLVATHLFSGRAAELGLFPVDFDDVQVALLGKSMDPLPFGAEIFPGEHPRHTPAWSAAVRAFVKAHPVGLRDLVLHSEVARVTMIGEDPLRFMTEPRAALAAFDRRLTHAPGPESPPQKALLDHIEARLDGDFPELTTNRGAKRVTLKKMRRDLEDELVAKCLSNILLDATERLEHVWRKPGNANILAQPFHQMTGFMHILSRTSPQDRGLGGWLRHGFANLVLRRPVGDAVELNRRLRHEVRSRLDELRRGWRQRHRDDDRLRQDFLSMLNLVTTFRAPAQAPPDRSERLRTYVKPTAPTTAPAVDDPVTPAAPIAPTPDPVVEFWDRVLDPAPSLDEARATFARLVEPDVTYVLPLARQGLRYRIQFSRHLIEQILNPAAGEPPDPRTWIGALRKGGARPLGQDGWKKLTVSVRGRYRWEIKVVQSRYRMLGLPAVEGLYRFETIEPLH